MSDDEYNSDDEVAVERAEALGYKPQHEIQINRLLPYADKVDEESHRLFIEIKTNLAKAVMLREMKPGCGIWTARLMKYIRTYGLKFSKEDHIALIKVVYELVLIPGLEPNKVQKFITLFVMLIRKRHLITPEELTIPWRPLYELGIRLFDNGLTALGMFHYVTSLEMSYSSAVKCAKPYFGLDATKEILEEFLPKYMPWSDLNQVLQMSMFIPVSLAPEHSAHGHELWFDEIMTLWDKCYNSPNSTGELMFLLSSIAKHNPGAIDWTPYVPTMFARFLHSMYLPVCYKAMQYSKSHSIDIKKMASWIVWTISPNGIVLEHLKNFLNGIESYLHNANSGRWSFKLRDLLRKLTKEFLKRVRREKEKKFLKSWENKTPDAYKLREEDITEFVKIMTEPVLLAVYYRHGSIDMPVALQNLATLRPAIVIPPLIEKLRTSLESLTEPHKLTVAINNVAAVARPLVRGALAGYPEGPSHVVPLLMALLPGIDPNDFKKTTVTFHFIIIYSLMVPYIDCSNAYEYWPDMTEEERLTCESTAQFEDFVLLFLDRLFNVVEASVKENVGLDMLDQDSSRTGTEVLFDATATVATLSILNQCSPKIFDEALRKFKTFALSTTFETKIAGNTVSLILRVFSRANAEKTMAAFVPDLCRELNELLSADDITKEDTLPREILYRILLLSLSIYDGPLVVKYVPLITPVLDKAYKLHSKEGLMYSCDVLVQMMIALNSVGVKGTQSSNKDYSQAPKTWLPIREWGKGSNIQEANLEWQIPGKEEADCAQMLFDRYALPQIERLNQWLSSERPLCKKRRLKAFYILHASLAGQRFLPPPEEPPAQLIESLVPSKRFPLYSPIKHQILLNGQNVRCAMTKILLPVQARMIDEKSDDTKGFEVLLRIWERLSGARTLTSIADSKYRTNTTLEKIVSGHGGPPGGGRLRNLLADSAKTQEEARLDMQSDTGIGETSLSILNALYELSVYGYTIVRVLAQVRIYWMLQHHPYSYRALLPKITDLLNKGGEGDEWHARHKGALYLMLGPRTAPIVSKPDWEVAKNLWTTVLKTPLSEKPSIIKLEQAFSEVLHRQFSTVNTRLTMTQSGVDTAKLLLNEKHLTDAAFLDHVSRAEAVEKATSDKNERVYKELLEELVKIAEAPNIQWHRLGLIMEIFTYVPSLETNYPVNTVRVIVNGLIHENIAVRKTAIRLTHFVLKQRKRRVQKVYVDPYEVAGVPKPETKVRGYRKDNEWAIWSEANIPRTDEDWKKPFLRKCDCGFYTWPEKLKVPLLTDEVMSVDRDPETMEEGERYVYEFFTNDVNVEKMVKFLTAEEKKGKDKFNGNRYGMFGMVFRCFGPSVGNKFLDYALKHAGDSQEASQRFAAEIVAAAITATRYWSRESTEAFHEKAAQVLRIGLTAVTPETTEDWGSCVASAVQDEAPNRIAIIIKTIFDLCAPQPTLADDVEFEQETSFVVCARLYALRGIISTMTWQIAPLASELLSVLQASRFLQHPYQNVRENVGSLLMSIFDTEMTFPGGSPGPAPQFSQFIDSLKPKLAALYDENGEIVIKAASCVTSMQCGVREPSVVSPPEPSLNRNDSLVPVSVALLSNDDQPTDDNSPPRGEAVQTDTSEGDSLALPGRAEKSLDKRLDSALRLSGDSTPGPKEHARAVNLLTTVFRSCLGILVRSITTSMSTHYELMQIACSLSARGPPQPHDELGRAADAFLASLAMSNHNEQEFDIALVNLKQVANSKSWWARLACVEFAQTLLFYGLPLMCSVPERAVVAEEFALKLMMDSRLEVRKAAAKLLTGLMHCQALTNEEKTIKKLIKCCRSKEIVERHCGVLGLCAYISSRPYGLGPRLGVVLNELSRHTNAPDPIPATIRTALADFRRTHQDDWPKHREALTEEELDLLADLTSPPSYCA